MPIKDGFQATLEIREIEKRESLEEIPIIALTASTSADEFKQAISVGMNAHLTKPIMRLVLEETLWRILQTKKMIGNNPIPIQRPISQKLYPYRNGNQIHYSFLPPFQNEI